MTDRDNAQALRHSFEIVQHADAHSAFFVQLAVKFIRKNGSEQDQLRLAAILKSSPKIVRHSRVTSRVKAA